MIWSPRQMPSVGTPAAMRRPHEGDLDRVAGVLGRFAVRMRARAP